MAKITYKNTFEPGLLYGGIAGGFSVLHSIVLYTLDASFSVYANVSTYVLPVIILFVMLYLYRNEYGKGTMSYSDGLGMGTLIMSIAGIIGAIYAFIFMKYIDPGFMQMAMQIQEDKMLAKGMDEATIERSMEMTAKLRTPGVILIFAILTSAFFGFVLSLIVSAFLKKEPQDPFAEVKQ
jgi:hypothetical protein